MLTLEEKAMYESIGHKVVYARVCVYDNGKEVSGLDEKGEPELRLDIDCDGKHHDPTVFIPATAICKFYVGDDVSTVKAKILADTPDLERVKEDGIIQTIDGPVSRVRTLVDRLPR